MRLRAGRWQAVRFRAGDPSPEGFAPVLISRLLGIALGWLTGRHAHDTEGAPVLTFVLLLAAFVLLALAAFGIGHPRVNFVAAGLACWVLIALIAAWPG